MKIAKNYHKRTYMVLEVPLQTKFRYCGQYLVTLGQSVWDIYIQLVKDTTFDPLLLCPLLSNLLHIAGYSLLYRAGHTCPVQCIFIKWKAVGNTHFWHLQRPLLVDFKIILQPCSTHCQQHFCSLSMIGQMAMKILEIPMYYFTILQRIAQRVWEIWLVKVTNCDPSLIAPPVEQLTPYCSIRPLACACMCVASSVYSCQWEGSFLENNNTSNTYKSNRVPAAHAHTYVMCRNQWCFEGLCYHFLIGLGQILDSYRQVACTQC